MYRVNFISLVFPIHIDCFDKEAYEEIKSIQRRFDHIGDMICNMNNKYYACNHGKFVKLGKLKDKFFWVEENAAVQ